MSTATYISSAQSGLERSRLTKQYGQIPTIKGIAHLQFVGEQLSDLAFKQSNHSHRSGDKCSVSFIYTWLKSFNNADSRKRYEMLYLKGTPFQLRVWQMLLEIPFGETTSYKAIAETIGAPRAFRAVGTAVGRNPISLLIPCHRVLPVNRQVGNYRWGADRKSTFLEMEKLPYASLLSFFRIDESAIQ